MIVSIFVVVFCLICCCVGVERTSKASPSPSNPSDSYGVFVGGQFYAKRLASSQTQSPGSGKKKRSDPLSTLPLNGLAQWTPNMPLQPLSDGVFGSGSVSRMVRNDSCVFVVGSFEWTRCEPRSCDQGYSSFSNKLVYRNMAVYDFRASTWSGVGQGCQGRVNDVLVVQDTVYVGGLITMCFNEPGVGSTEVLANNVLAWDKKNGWQDKGGPASLGVVTSIAYHPGLNLLFAAGNSGPDAPSPFVFLQSTNGSAWNQISVLKVTLTDPNSISVVRCFGDWLYIGGTFKSFGNNPLYTSNIVRISVHDSSVLDVLSGGVSGPVSDIVSYGKGVIVGGVFQFAQFPIQVVVNDLAFYSDDTGWQPFGEFHKRYNSSWQVMSLDTLPDGAVVASGIFKTVGSNSSAVNNIAVFNELTSEWNPVGPVGSDSTLEPFTLYSVAFAGQHQVVAFGSSGTSGDIMLASYLEPEGWAFERQPLLDLGLVSCAALSDVHGLVLGGVFSSNGHDVVRSLALWNQSTIQQLGSGAYGTISGLTFLGDYLYVVGTYTPMVATGSVTHTFGRLNMLNMTWFFPTLPPSSFWSFLPFHCVHAVGSLVFVGGEFTFLPSNSSVGATSLIAYDHQHGNWISVGASQILGWSPQAVVHALADNTTHLFVVGNFLLQTNVGNFYNLACFDLKANAWINFPLSCDLGDQCLQEEIRSVAVQDNVLVVGGNFTFIGPGQIRKRVNNVAILNENGAWAALEGGLFGLLVVSLALINTTVANLTIVAAGPKFLQIYSPGNEWTDVDQSWSYNVQDIRVVLPFYFSQNYVPGAWPVFAYALAVILALLVITGFIIVICLMRRRGNSRSDYSLLDVVAHEDDDAWLIDYESLQIQNPPIGKGAYSVVNRAVLKGTVVAVKTYVGTDYYGDLTADFNREIALLTRLRHPNIILFIGACRSPLCIVTELAERGCLYDVIRQTPHEMTWSRIKSIALDSCKGLAYLHNQVPPILHRDLKSANILISDNFVAKISDFGIAKRLAVHTMTQRVGTTRWTAPEVLTNKTSSHAYSLGSDVYSFGVIIWEMMTLQLPWGNVAFDFQIEDRVTSGEHLPVPEATTPSQYRELMLQCWAMDSQARPPFTALIQQIEAIPYIHGSPERPQQEH